MFATSETKERKHLEYVQSALRAAVADIDTGLWGQAAKIREQKTYLWEHRADMDHVKKIATRQSVEQTVLAADIDRGLLYVACTRAMHQLTLTYTGQVSRFVDHDQ